MAMTLEQVRSAAMQLSPEDRENLRLFLAEEAFAFSEEEKSQVLAMCEERMAALRGGRLKTRDAFESLADLQAKHLARRPQP